MKKGFLLLCTLILLSACTKKEPKKAIDRYQGTKTVCVTSSTDAFVPSEVIMIDDNDTIQAIEVIMGLTFDTKTEADLAQAAAQAGYAKELGLDSAAVSVLRINDTRLDVYVDMDVAKHIDQTKTYAKFIHIANLDSASHAASELQSNGYQCQTK